MSSIGEEEDMDHDHHGHQHQDECALVIICYHYRIEFTTAIASRDVGLPHLKPMPPAVAAAAMIGGGRCRRHQRAQSR